MASVIVFGPTGSIGSVAARAAEQQGAKVWLAMRDTSKVIPGLSADEEKSGRYERVQADLTNPESLEKAVQTSGANRAFIYLVHHSRDHMKASLEALRSAGIEFIVFLSSFTIYDEPGKIPADEIIPYVHARVEISLDEVFGRDRFVAVRPGVFLTNMREYNKDIAAGEVAMHGADWEMDCVTPTDIGEISGIILATGPRNKQNTVYVYGPEIMPQREVVKRIAKVLGKDVKVKDLVGQDAYDSYAKAGLPEVFINYMFKAKGRNSREESRYRTHYEEGVRNVQLYTGRSAMRLEPWVEANKTKFVA